MPKRALAALCLILLIMTAGCFFPVAKVIDQLRPSGPPYGSSPTPPISLSPSPSPSLWLPSFPLPTETPSPLGEAPSPAKEESGLSLTQDELRELAFGAVLTARNPMHYETLDGINDTVVFGAHGTLYSSYGVYDRETARSVLDWLAKDGHRGAVSLGFDAYLPYLRGEIPLSSSERELIAPMMKAYEVLVETLIKDYGYTQEELDGITTVSAWDYDRLVTVARWCYSAGYIAEKDAWDFIGVAAAEGVRDYNSWREYFAGVMMGRALWSSDQVFTLDNRVVADKLLKDADSIYAQVPFQSSGAKREASREYQTYEEIVDERLKDHTVEMKAEDILSEYADGLSEDYKIKIDDENYSVNARSGEHAIYFSVYTASNGAARGFYLTIYSNGIQHDPLEEYMTLLQKEYQRVAGIIGIDMKNINDAFDPALMETSETKLDGNIFLRGERLISDDEFELKTEYTKMDGQLLSVSAVLFKE